MAAFAPGVVTRACMSSIHSIWFSFPQ